MDPANPPWNKQDADDAPPDKTKSTQVKSDRGDWRGTLQITIVQFVATSLPFTLWSQFTRVMPASLMASMST